jgi:hypothetical protein
MEGMEHVMLSEDDPIIDPVSPYVPDQLRYHEAA